MSCTVLTSLKPPIQLKLKPGYSDRPADVHPPLYNHCNDPIARNSVRVVVGYGAAMSGMSASLSRSGPYTGTNCTNDSAGEVVVLGMGSSALLPSNFNESSGTQ